MTTKDSPLENLALLLAAVGEQRAHLLNVLGTVKCVKRAADVDDEVPELAGALELLEREVQAS